MRTFIIAFVILGSSAAILEVLGLWLVNFGNKTSERYWSFIGKYICWAAPLLLIVDTVGLLIGGLR